MCIIIVKPAGVELPSSEILERCETFNPDGFGFATAKGVFHTMDKNVFNEQLKHIRKGENAIIHCRIATHGSVKQTNCHPFYDPATGVSFAHNGVLAIKPIGDKTDSETAFLKYFLPVIRRKGFDSDALAESVGRIIGASRFAFISRRGNVRLFGHFTKMGDCYYSHPVW